MYVYIYIYVCIYIYICVHSTQLSDCTGTRDQVEALPGAGAALLQRNLLHIWTPASVYETYSVGPSIRPMLSYNDYYDPDV